MGYKPFETYIHRMHFTVITDHLVLKVLKYKFILTGKLLRRAEKMLDYDFDSIYWPGKRNVVPNFLSRLYLVELTSPDEDEKDQEIFKNTNKIFVPFANRSQFFERAQRNDTGHLSAAKL